ncbi:MAG: insulinase family protein [Paludibacteraceae bacterium]|nr:insulinase family protein [Paludibacteraceae bacterium]
MAYVGVMIGAGTRDERPEENGMAHYIEHCVFKGTVFHSARQIISQIEGVGGEINAYTTKEETTFYAATLNEHVPQTLRLISEMVLCPTFPKAETDKERMVIYDEIESYNDSPSELIYDDFENMLFAGHSLAQPILGTKRTLRNISKSPDRPRAWMAQHYRPERMVVFCQGDIPASRFVRLAEHAFGGYTNNLPPDRQLSFAQEEDRQPQSASYQKHTHQTHVMLGARAYPIAHEKQLPLYLLNNILGGGSLNSRLNIALRESRGLVYTIESIYTPLSDTGYWSTYFACEPEQLEQCMSVINRELQRLIRTPLTPRELRAALRQLRGQMAISAQNAENNALAMAKSMLYRDYAPTWQETFEQIAAVTPAQLLEVAHEILNPDNLVVLKYA